MKNLKKSTEKQQSKSMEELLQDVAIQDHVQ